MPLSAALNGPKIAQLYYSLCTNALNLKKYFWFMLKFFLYLRVFSDTVE